MRILFLLSLYKETKIAHVLTAACMSRQAVCYSFKFYWNKKDLKANSFFAWVLVTSMKKQDKN
jgi:hypothetical protein